MNIDVKFLTDVHLGKLANFLRMLGFDTIGVESNLTSKELDKISVKEDRTLLTRNKGLKFNNMLLIKSEDPHQQLVEVLESLEDDSIPGFLTRCLECNTPLVEIAKEKVMDQLPPRVKEQNEKFLHCCTCWQVYWEGTHVDKMKEFLRKLNL